MNRKTAVLVSLAVGGVLGWSVGFLTFNNRLRAMADLRDQNAQLATAVEAAKQGASQALASEAVMAQVALDAASYTNAAKRTAQALQTQLDDTRAQLERNAEFDTLGISKTWLAKFSPEDYSRNYIAEAVNVYTICKGLTGTARQMGEALAQVRAENNTMLHLAGLGEFNTQCSRRAISFAVLFPQPLILENRIVSDAELFTKIAEDASNGAPTAELMSGPSSELRD